MAPREPGFAGALPIDGYGPGFFRIAGAVHRGGLLIHAEAAMPWTGFDDLDALRALAGQVDLLLCGMGADIAHLPKGLQVDLEALGVMAEPMSTASAARHYNVLLSEGRRVGAALLPIPGAVPTA
ncbi:Mth938-like domain-containing protein [Rhodobacter capsulatus]|uniref:Mth938-like domain-containing protein n=1 Tax=Rhodobacter capsulatus TaxID=1061 RepID=UPI0003D399F2|nr:Mth938-like domain-containing protein [Rhodobacter capsulatus]ETD81215.1 hypothetical protein U716_11155 [Rhodobacter capsulatus B6]